MRRRHAVLAGTALALACNQRHPLEEHMVPEQPSSVAPAPAPLPASTSTLSTLTLRPRGFLGGSSARGTVVLTLPAPAGGSTVTLSTTDPALSVSPSVIVPAGRDSAEFTVTTRAVAAQRDAIVTAAVPERSVSASVTLWNLEPVFFSFAHDDPIFSGADPTRRVLPPAASFAAFCDTNIVEFRISEGDRNSWSGRFDGPPNLPLAVGTYVVTRSGTRPSVSIGGTGLACSGGYNGEFTVREADYQANGTITQFWASFDLHCNNTGSPDLHGDIRFGHVPTGFPPPPFALSCRLP